MSNYTLDSEEVKKLNSIIEEKNDLSILNRFDSAQADESDIDKFKLLDIANNEGKVDSNSFEFYDALVNPIANVNILFTGGSSTYEHSINYSKNTDKPISFTSTPNNLYIQEDNVEDVIETIETFIGKSNLKSLSFNKTYTKYEAYVFAALIDLERKAILRAFIDEMPYSTNTYNSNVIWRMLNSTSSSIQWFAYIMMNMAHEDGIITQNQVTDAISKLIEKGDIIDKGSVYQPSKEITLLANRMIIVDNIMSVQSNVIDDNEDIKSAGFTSIQSGIHDILFLDYNQEEVVIETISSSKLLECLKKVIDREFYEEDND